LRQWEAHDLIFHARSRMGRHDAPLGGTFRFAGELPHAPALKPPGPGGRVGLPRPEMATETATAAPSRMGADFFAVVEARRSLRQAGAQPLTLDQLGTLLWYVARVQRYCPANPDDPRQYESTLRPVAGGGAMHELELYLTVTRCTGLEPALYRYDPGAHELEWISAPSPDTEALVRDAMRAAAMETPPDMLITLAARFARMAWKYEGMAYAAILKHVGVLYQQLYLVATALGLSPCAIGGGDSDRFAAAAATTYHDETSVGEFAVSGPPDPS
jgi:SagB-type dehydrogenase family enzyme